MKKNIISIAFLITGISCLSYSLINLTNRAFISAQAIEPLVAYNVPQKFALLLPRNWLPETKLSDKYSFYSFTNYRHNLGEQDAPTDAVKTEVMFIDKKLELVLESRIAEANLAQEIITRRGNLEVDGQNATRIWYQGGDWNFPNEIATYIPYEDYNQTVVLSSYYDADNPTAVDTIQRIHWSFRRLDRYQY